MIVRPASGADLDAIEVIAREVLTDPWSRQSLAEELARPHAEVLVAEESAGKAPLGGIFGFAIAWFVADEATLLLIAVRANAQRRGAGARLLRAIEARARKRGARTMHLEVRASNEAARAFYRARAYIETGTRARYYGGTEDAVLMSRTLPDVDLVILAGGQAKRLGGILKPLLVRNDGRTILSGLERALLPSVLEAMLVAPPDLLARLDETGRFLQVADPGDGPGAALARAARASEAEWLFVTGGDQPNLGAPLLEHLKEARDESADAVAFEIDGILQPLGALYRRRVFTEPARSLTAQLRAAHTRVLDGAPWRNALEDADTPSDLERLALVCPP